MSREGVPHVDRSRPTLLVIATLGVFLSFVSPWVFFFVFFTASEWDPWWVDALFFCSLFLPDLWLCFTFIVYYDYHRRERHRLARRSMDLLGFWLLVALTTLAVLANLLFGVYGVTTIGYWIERMRHP